jgi:hypothetical protein
MLKESMGLLSSGPPSALRSAATGNKATSRLIRRWAEYELTNSRDLFETLWT